MPRQRSLQFNPVKNSGLLSSHWLEHRLQDEPEWDEVHDEARAVLERLGRLWDVQRTRVERYESEAALEQAFIQPVLEILGWKLNYQPFLERRVPDYALFLTDTALQQALAEGRRSTPFWRHPVVVADAKAWHRSLDRPETVNHEREYPPQQIEWYLDRSRLDYGILTNGRLWRLVPRERGPQQRRFETYLEADLRALLEGWRSQRILIDDFLEFYLFFSPVAFAPRERRKPLIARAVDGSTEYRLGVGENLKQRAFRALELCIDGFLTHAPNGLDAPRDLELCRQQSFVLLYRLLFIMFAEDRRLLPYRVNETYTNNRSLARHRDEIAANLDRVRDQTNLQYAHDQTGIWDSLAQLFDLVDNGQPRYGVPAYNGGLFDPDKHRFLKDKKIADWHLAQIIDQLGRAEDPDNPRAGLSRVDYRDLAIQHLGSVYEGLLELQPHHATERMLVVTRRVLGRDEENVIPVTQPVPSGWTVTEKQYQRGAIYVQTHKGERRATGSYYTPDHIVDYLVERTLKPLCDDIAAQLQAEIDDVLRAGRVEDAERLRRDFDDRVLSLRVLDPAMGSGHFLIRACQRLGEELATHPLSSDAALSGSADDESAISFWKRRVAECCLYGVDLNPLAVELAQLAMWLETVAVNRPLTFLEHHLRPGNSLVGARLAKLGALPQVIELRENVAGQVLRQLPALLEPLHQIRRIPSETVAQIKDKERRYAAVGKARRPFLLTADLWCSAFVERALSDEQYENVAAAIAEPRKLSQLSRQPWFEEALFRARRPDMRPFHWEIEFPEAFFDSVGPLAAPGFHAVIGNPPYDVLSELENKTDLTALRRFIEYEAIYAPSMRGKNNLYKLFVCRALDLLADGGRLGFITPMAILGDDQAAGIRREIVRVASFTGIEAFPQKDRPAERVFPEAKLSTAAFTLVKRATADPFRSRVHPGRTIDRDSPGLQLTTADIGLYDSENSTIVSCSQEDWDLATRIMRSGRMRRLRDVAEFFQGEVNETNERKRGALSNAATGMLVTRGASICLYVTRPASQGEDLYIDVDRFLDGKGAETKAFHHRFRRIGLQESSPQNNFRRIIAALVPAGHYCNHTVNYCPEPRCTIPIELLLASLNSKLAEWYFRLGSTNAHVSHYQLMNLPIPVFELDSQDHDSTAVGTGPGMLARLEPHLVSPPFGPSVCNAIVRAVRRIHEIEQQRGEIRRVERSALHPEAQPFQDFIDRLFYRMAGLSDDEAAGLEQRLARMQ